jgi:putative sigma-54 modulation protein
MQLEIHSRRFNLGDEMKEKIVEKMENLKRYSPSEPIAIRMALTFEAGAFTGDLALNLKQQSFHAKVSHAEPDGAAAQAVESVERQLRRYKDRMKDHRGRAVQGGLGAAMGELPAEVLDNPGSAFVEDGFELRDLQVEEAKAAYDETDGPFFVFRNAETGVVNVLYRRDDGEFGLMKPED